MLAKWGTLHKNVWAILINKELDFTIKMCVKDGSIRKSRRIKGNPRISFIF